MCVCVCMGATGSGARVSYIGRGMKGGDRGWDENGGTEMDERGVWIVGWVSSGLSWVGVK